MMLTVLAVAVMISGCSLLPMEEEALVPPLVQPVEEELRTIEASLGSIETFLRGTANFTSAKEASLSFKENGKLKSINVTHGQMVEEGQLLAELDTGDLEQQLNLRRLDMERTQLQFMQAVESGVTGINLRIREIDLEKEQMSLDSMEARLENTRIYAPMSGIVSFQDNKETNENVSAYEEILSIQDPTQVQLVYTASQSKDLLALQIGMPLNIHYRGVDYEGELLQTPSSIPAGADPRKAEMNAVRLIIGIKDPPEDVQLGHAAQITIPLQQRENVIVLPRSAVRSYMNRTYVQVLEGELRKDVDVEVGLSTPTEVEIVKGIEVGQIVVY